MGARERKLKRERTERWKGKSDSFDKRKKDTDFKGKGFDRDKKPWERESRDNKEKGRSFGRDKKPWERESRDNKEKGRSFGRDKKPWERESRDNKEKGRSFGRDKKPWERESRDNKEKGRSFGRDKKPWERESRDNKEKGRSFGRDKKPWERESVEKDNNWKGRPRDKFYRDKAIERGEFDPHKKRDDKPKQFEDKENRLNKEEVARYMEEKREPIKPTQTMYPMEQKERAPREPRFERSEIRLDDGSHGNLIIKRNKIYTLSKDKLQWYGEKVIKTDNGYLREFEAKRSKIGAAIKKGFRFNLHGKNILYLGSSSGTTVSHLSDLTDKEIIGVDIAPIVMREFLLLAEQRQNVIPLLYDASALPNCEMLKNQKFDLVFEDIAQRNMVETFIDNFKAFSKPDGEGWLSLKTRSIDSTIPPKAVLDVARKKLETSGLKIKKIYDLEPFEKEHFFIVVGF